MLPLLQVMMSALFLWYVGMMIIFLTKEACHDHIHTYYVIGPYVQVGAMAHGVIDKEYTDDFIASKFSSHLTSRVSVSTVICHMILCQVLVGIMLIFYVLVGIY